MTAKQKQLEYQAVTLQQLHETGLQYEARFKKHRQQTRFVCP